MMGVSSDQVADVLDQTGSLIQTIDRLRVDEGQGRTLRDYRLPDLNGAEEWLADNEILDPEGPDMIFEQVEKRGLFRGWERLRNRFRRHR